MAFAAFGMQLTLKWLLSFPVLLILFACFLLNSCDTTWALNFSKEREESDLIKQQAETPKRREFENLLFSLTLLPTREKQPWSSAFRLG